MSEVPANVAAARQQVITTDYYALGYLALCIASYDDEADSPDDIVQGIQKKVPALGQIGDVPGRWTLDWGPAVTMNPLSKNANLLFAASYRDPASNLPIFSAVVIRGTDTEADFLGLLTQIKEDLEPGCQLSWPTGLGACADATQSASDAPYIARGTFMGFKDLTGLQGKNQSTQAMQTVTELVAELLSAYADAAAPLPLVVTGHSLGGCQTAPMALHLNDQAVAQGGVTVVPNSFAAPTAGNQAFADLYLRTLPNARRWFNTFDLVPMAFNHLPTMRELWSVAPYSCGCPLPFWAPPLLDLFEDEVAHLQYAHEGGTANRQLAGVCGSTSCHKHSWGKQLEYQHFPPTGYWPLMVEQYSSVLGSMKCPAKVDCSS